MTIVIIIISSSSSSSITRVYREMEVSQTSLSPHYNCCSQSVNQIFKTYSFLSVFLSGYCLFIGCLFSLYCLLCTVWFLYRFFLWLYMYLAQICVHVCVE
ncbi:hypothetical protein BD289DRAFT_438892 [Coniella lustricola]|uniref:Uncharacterized protein n=1 Tax=Coniella lustricola TaxID=2025994 RepID=A0A2T3A283_9PEZI|nr:hypothetical protein BD289DRAFT_438892 [Coniella lustricola]